MASISNRMFALATCALVVGCTEAPPTAPPATLDVTAAALPTTFGTEYGTITFTATRGDANTCDVKIALRNLWVDPDDIDWYQLYVGTALSPQVEAPAWNRQIMNSEVSRAAFRGAGYAPITKTYLQGSSYYLGLAYYWDGTANGVNDGNYLNDRQIGQFQSGGFYLNEPDFKVVNRCF